MEKIKQLVAGPKASGLEPSDYDFDLKTEVWHISTPLEQNHTLIDALGCDYTSSLALS